MTSTDEEHPIVARYLQKVEAALKTSDATAQERTQTIAMLREQIEEALAVNTPPDRVIAAMDPPSAYTNSAGHNEAPASALGRVGLFAGLLLAVTGLLVIPALAPHMRLALGNPLVLASALVSLTMGYADRADLYGRLSLLFGLMVSAFIAAATLFNALAR